MVTKITVVDDGGPVRGRLVVNVAPGPDNGDTAALVAIGELEIRVAGVEEIAAERCQTIAGEFHRMALELLRSTIAPVPEAPPPAPGVNMLPAVATGLERMVEARDRQRPTIFDCGCSRHKVEAGLCSIYDEHGESRANAEGVALEQRIADLRALDRDVDAILSRRDLDEHDAATIRRIVGGM